MILVTGASGLLGSNMVMEARTRGIPLAITIRTHSPSLEAIPTYKLDLADATAVKKAIAEIQPSWIVHCAAETNVEWCERHPDDALRTNASIPRHLAEAARSNGAALLFISSDSVFSGDTGHYLETDAPAPRNRYAESKLAGERAVQQTLDNHLVIRTNLYGWNMQEKLSLAEWALSRLERGDTVPGFSDVFFNPLLVNDLCEVLFSAMDQNLRGLFHVGSSTICSKYDFARSLATVFDLDPSLVQDCSVDHSPLTAPRPKNTTLDITRISRALDRPLPDLPSGLARLRRLRDTGYVQSLKAMGGIRNDHA